VAAIDLRSIDVLRDRAVHEKLGLSNDQRVEIGRRLALTLDRDQRDLLQMILGQYHADRNRLRELEDPTFDDDEEGTSYELPRLRAMVGEFPGRAAAMVDRVLTPEQRAALGPRLVAADPEEMFKSLLALQGDSVSRIAATLTPSQRDRLKQLTLDAEGPLAAARPEVAARLNLCREHQAQVQTIWNAAQADLNRLRDPSPASPAYRDGDDLEVRIRPKLTTVRRESASILSDAGARIRKILLRSQIHQGPPDVGPKTRR
jgi:hypothetical protein